MAGCNMCCFENSNLKIKQSTDGSLLILEFRHIMTFVKFVAVITTNKIICAGDS
jgi:hypothetical protein